MDTQMTAPEPGWYVDPAGQDLLRLWDGTRWTDSTRPRDVPAREVPQPSAQADESMPARPEGRTGRLRHLGLWPTLVAVAIVGVLAYLLATVLSGSSSSSSSQSAPSRPLTRTPATVARIPGSASFTGCKPTAPSDALLAARWFGFKYTGSNLTPTGDAPKPTGSCSAETFVDPRGSGSNLVVVYPTSAAASNAAATHVSGAGPTAAAGTYVVVLDPSLAPHEGQYVSWLKTLVAKSQHA